ncbi:hypothetical protein RF11_13605 [Thelohanellus kitauei]|uniref:Uncharacterized protein n=1 Tax=Thelohanellus kitauei TaxID=669202 RepID=A0A0C2MGR6_THEKT|nr:hypothetical protein RF11_13605 [Thelohanellus kitauei]
MEIRTRSIIYIFGNYCLNGSMVSSVISVNQFPFEKKKGVYEFFYFMYPYKFTYQGSKIISLIVNRFVLRTPSLYNTESFKFLKAVVVQVLGSGCTTVHLVY